MNALIETFNRWGEAAIPLAGQMLWQTSLLIIVLLALDLLLRHRIRAGFRYALWMLLLVKLVLPPSLALPTGAGYWIERPAKAEAPVKPPVAEEASLPAPAVEINHAADPGIIVDSDFFELALAEAMADAPPAATTIGLPVEPEPAIQLNRPGQLLTAWLAGTLLLLGWMLWRWRWVNRLVRASEPAPADLQALLANVCRTSCPTPNFSQAACRHFPETARTAEGHERKGDTPVAQSRIEATRVSPFRLFGMAPACPKLRLTDAAMSPAVCGLFRPVILLPRKLVGKLSREQLGTVLLHELIHLRRRDLWVNCAQTLLQIAAWWHPLLWLANARIRRVREEAVDEAVACALRDDADAYPATLLEVAKLTFTRPLMTLGLVGILESKHALKQRIHRLLELPPLESTRLKWWQWVVVAAIALTALPMAEGQRPADVAGSDPSTLNSGDQVQEQVAAADESAGKNVEEHDAAVERAYDVLLERLNRLGSDIPALTNALHEAQMELEKYQAERSAVLLRMLVSDVWLLDKTILEHPFVKRHMNALNLAPPPEWVAIDERYQTARKVRDMISMKLVQEKINQALLEEASPSGAETFLQSMDSLRRETVRAQEAVRRAQTDYDRLQKELGPDPLQQPDQTLNKAEFLKLIPVIEARLRLDQATQHLETTKIILSEKEAGLRKLAQGEARINDQGSLSPQSGVGNPAVNPTRPPITMQVRAVKLSRHAWHELVSRTETQPVTEQTNVFIHRSSTLNEWLNGHAGIEIIESAQVTVSEHQATTIGAFSPERRTVEPYSQVRVELTPWFDQSDLNQIWLKLDTTIDWSGLMSKSGYVSGVPGSGNPAGVPAGSAFSRARGYVNQQIKTDGVGVSNGHWVILGGRTDARTIEPIFAVMASPLFAQSARATPGQESDNSAGTSSAGQNLPSETSNRVNTPPLSLGHTHLAELDRQMITAETPLTDPRFKSYPSIGLEPRFMLVPVEGLTKALGGRLLLGRPLIVVSNKHLALTSSLIEAGAINHSLAEPFNFSKKSGLLFHWQVAKEESSSVSYHVEDSSATNNAGGNPRGIAYIAKQGITASAPDWVPLTLLARPLAEEDGSLRCTLSLATGTLEPKTLVKAEETIPLGGSLVWASTNKVKTGFAQVVVLRNTGERESTDGSASEETTTGRSKEAAGSTPGDRTASTALTTTDTSRRLTGDQIDHVYVLKGRMFFKAADGATAEGMENGLKLLSPDRTVLISVDEEVQWNDWASLLDTLRAKDIKRVAVHKLTAAQSAAFHSSTANPANSSSQPPAAKADESNDGAGEAAAKIQSAKELIEAGKLDEAEALLREAAKADPGNTEISYHLDRVQQLKLAPKALPNPYAQRPPIVQDSPGRHTIMEKLNRITMDQVGFDNVPLSEVIKELADESRRRDPEEKGINFMIVSRVFNSATAASFATDPATGAPIATAPSSVETPDVGGTIVAINPPFSNLRLIDVLNTIVMSADRPIKFTVEEFAVVFSPKTPEPEHLETRVFRVNPNTFYEGLQGVFTNLLATTPARTNAPAPAPTVQAPGGGGIRFLTTNDMSVVNVAVRGYFEMAGVKFEPPKLIHFNDRTGMLMVRATPADLEIVQRAVEMLNYEPPQITLEVRTVEVTKDDVRALGFDWFMSPVPSQSASRANTITGILTDPQFTVVMKALEQRSNVDVNLFPRTTTLSDHPTQIKSTIMLSNMVVAVTNTPAGQSYLTDDVEVGTKLDLAPQVGADGYTIRLGVMFERTDFLGYSDPVETGKPAGTPLPRFKLFSMATTANVWDGQTLVLGGTPPEPGLQTSDMERRHFLIFITPTIIDPAGNRVHSAEQMPFTQEQVPRQPGQE